MRQEIGILGLVAREGDGGRHHAAKRFVVRLVGGGARGAAIDHGADGDAERMFGDILVNRVVGEARERVGCGADVDFGFVRFAQLEDLLGDALEFRERSWQLAS